MKPIFFIILIVFGLCQNTHSATTEMPAEVSSALKKYAIPQQALSLEVKQIGHSKPIFSLNPQSPRNPASVMKLVTTLAALELLGPDFVWKTRYFLDGSFNQGELKGSLVIQGNGDPYLTTDQFRHQLSALRQRGLRTISGDLVIDNSIFDAGSQDRAMFDGQPDRVYNVIPGSSMVNFSASRILLIPQREKLRIIVDPPTTALQVINRISLTNGPCRGRWAGWNYTTKTTGDDTILDFRGKFSRKCGEIEFTRALLSNQAYIYGVFRSMWEEVGGKLGGRGRVGRPPNNAVPFFEAESRPLAQVIGGINKFSNNVMARQLLLTVGKQFYGEPANPRNGVTAIQQWLVREGIEMPTLVIENGAGLSRLSRVSVAGLSNLLRRGWESTYRPEFLSSLSIAGIDGTMRKRLKKEAPQGRVRIKTGLLNETRAMAGYVRSNRGNQYTVAMILNHPKVNYWSGNRVQDVLLRWLLHH